MNCTPWYTRRVQKATKALEMRDARRLDLERLVIRIHRSTFADSGWCKFSNEKLATGLGWGLYKLHQVRNLAERLGWIEVVRYPSRAGGQGPNHCRVLWDKIGQFEPQSSSKRTVTKKTKTQKAGCAFPESANRRAGAPKEEQQKKENTKAMARDGVQMNGIPKKTPQAKPITREQLSDPTFLDKTYTSLASKGKITRSEESKRTVFAAASYAMRKGSNPGGLFMHIVLGRGAYGIPDMDDDAAGRMLKALDRGPAPLPPAKTAPIFTPQPEGEINAKVFLEVKDHILPKYKSYRTPFSRKQFYDAFMASPHPSEQHKLTFKMLVEKEGGQ